MEHAIGEIVTLPDGRKAEVVEWDVWKCRNCIFGKDESCDKLCLKAERTDNKNIIYKEIKEK